MPTPRKPLSYPQRLLLAAAMAPALGGALAAVHRQVQAPAPQAFVGGYVMTLAGPFAFLAVTDVDRALRHGQNEALLSIGLLCASFLRAGIVFRILGYVGLGIWFWNGLLALGWAIT